MLVHVVVFSFLYVVPFVAVVITLVYLLWGTVEQRVLRGMLSRKLTTTYGTAIKLSKLEVRERGLRLEGVVIANDGVYRSPYFGKFEKVEIKTAGLRGLASLAGVFKLRKFVFGFPVRDVEEFIITDVRIFIEPPNHAFLARAEAEQRAQRQRHLDEEVRLHADFRAKWRHHHDDDNATVEHKEDSIDDDDTVGSRLKKLAETLRKQGTFTERKANVLHLREIFRQRDARAKVAKKQDKATPRWRIGRIALANITVDLPDGQTHCLDHFEYRGFVGDSSKLLRKILLGLNFPVDLLPPTGGGGGGGGGGPPAMKASKVAGAVKSQVKHARTRLFRHSSRDDPPPPRPAERKSSLS